MDGGTRELVKELDRLKRRFSDRDGRMDRIALARTPGGLSMVYPDMFPSEDGFQEPMVANMIDVAARDLAEMIAPLPSFNCSSGTTVSDRARKFAAKRTAIGYGYVDASDLQVQMYSAADQYNTYGFLPGVVRFDFDKKTPVIRMLDPKGCYYVRDQWGRVIRFYQSVSMTATEAVEMYPELRWILEKNAYSGNETKVELVRFIDDRVEGLFTTTGDGQMLRLVENPVGECMVHIFKRPGLSDEVIGQFDDVLPVQVAKAKFAILGLEGATKAVQAPLAIPQDVQELAFGPDSILRSSTPEKIRRVDINLPQSAFMQQAQLDQELRQGSRYPDIRTGNTDASIVTGRGAQALMGGFDTQIKTAQAVFAHGLQKLMSWCFKADEAMWPQAEKTLRGNANGTPYEIKYRPDRDIKGDHTVEVQYGLMAGLQPNQALVFGLQARGDKLISRDFLRRQMPFSIDANAEEQKVDTEELRDSLKEAVAGYAASIPALAAQGQDPTQILTRMAQIIGDRQKGVAIEESIVKAFAPEPAPPAPEMAMAGGGGDPMAAMMGGGGLPPGLDAAGLMQGVAPGQQAMGPGGRPDVMSLLASLGPRGNANLDAGIARRLPI